MNSEYFLLKINKQKLLSSLKNFFEEGIKVSARPILVLTCFFIKIVFIINKKCMEI